ncbi:3-deoxy-manno-octulosonate cytidylyltransferase [Sesbania bispinosa]|nr:3-deoxy-manno-octulosonate cytidylyltransferase [Sesbania bispinosa]
MPNVKQMSYHNRVPNEDFRFMHNEYRFIGTYHYQPSMIQHFGQAQFSSRVHIKPQYPIQHPFHNSTMLHGMNSFTNAPQNFTNALNEVERKVGQDTKCFNPR